jgi:acyl-CoA synthetase (AMP-forming)/AMP-acid ligase II
VEDVSREEAEAEVAVRPEALALIQFSSGSTVDPKPVALSHANLLAQLAALVVEMPLTPDVVPMGVSWLPLYHDMGLIGCLLAAPYYPGSLVLIPPEVFLARPVLWLRALSRYRVSSRPRPTSPMGCASAV